MPSEWDALRRSGSKCKVSLRLVAYVLLAFRNELQVLVYRVKNMLIAPVNSE